MTDNQTKVLKFCPVCEAQGRTTPLKFYFVNFEETVLLCTERLCPYPYGHAEFTFSCANENIDIVQDCNINAEPPHLDDLEKLIEELSVDASKHNIDDILENESTNQENIFKILVENEYLPKSDHSDKSSSQSLSDLIQYSNTENNSCDKSNSNTVIECCDNQRPVSSLIISLENFSSSIDINLNAVVNNQLSFEQEKAVCLDRSETTTSTKQSDLDSATIDEQINTSHINDNVNKSSTPIDSDKHHHSNLKGTQRNMKDFIKTVDKVSHELTKQNINTNKSKNSILVKHLNLINSIAKQRSSAPGLNTKEMLEKTVRDLSINVPANNATDELGSKNFNSEKALNSNMKNMFAFKLPEKKSSKDQVCNSTCNIDSVPDKQFEESVNLDSDDESQSIEKYLVSIRKLSREIKNKYSTVTNTKNPGPSKQFKFFKYTAKTNSGIITADAATKRAPDMQSRFKKNKLSSNSSGFLLDCKEKISDESEEKTIENFDSSPLKTENIYFTELQDQTTASSLSNANLNKEIPADESLFNCSLNSDVDIRINDEFIKNLLS